MKNNLIFLDLEYNDCFTFLNGISDELFKLGYVKESFKTAIVEREKKFPTGLPVDPIGVAIPHSDSEHINTAGIAFVKFKNDVIFTDMTGVGQVKVKIAFILLVKDKEKQVNILQKMMEVITNSDVLSDLYNEKNNENIIKILEGVGL